MANIGETSEIVNASELTLVVDSDTYILVTDLVIHTARTEDRTATTDAGVLYTYGKGDNWFTATLIGTTPEFITWNTKTQIDAVGDMPTTAFLIKGKTPTSTITWTVTGVVRDTDTRRGPDGKVLIDVFVRITADTVSVA